MDLVVALLRSDNFTHLLTMIDRFSNLTETILLKNIDTKTIQDSFFLENSASRHGVLENLTTLSPNSAHRCVAPSIPIVTEQDEPPVPFSLLAVGTPLHCLLLTLATLNENDRVWHQDSFLAYHSLMSCHCLHYS